MHFLQIIKKNRLFVAIIANFAIINKNKCSNIRLYHFFLTAKIPYKSLNHSLKLMRVQIMEGVPYAVNELPKFTTQKQLFDYLKQRVKYKNDFENIEVFQTLPTLLTANNVHNQPGAGDCDCFTIAALTCLIANNFNNSGIVLVGRNNSNAVHIYAYSDVNGKREYLDLTNKNYNQIRHYDYKQEIPLNLSKTEINKIKSMQLQLADGNFTTLSSMKKQAQKARNLVKSNAREYINNPFAYTKSHIFIPSKKVFIREDMADNMPFNEFTEGLISEGYSAEQIQELSAKRAERKAEKTTGKTERKATKTTAKADKKTAKQDRKTTRVEKKERVSAEDKGGIFKGITDTVGGIGKGLVSKYTGAAIPDTDTPGEGTTTTTLIKKETPGAEDDKLFGLPKKAVYIGGGLLLVSAIAFFATRKK